MAGLNLNGDFWDDIVNDITSDPLSGWKKVPPTTKNIDISGKLDENVIPIFDYQTGKAINPNEPNIFDFLNSTDDIEGEDNIFDSPVEEYDEPTVINDNDGVFDIDLDVDKSIYEEQQIAVAQRAKDYDQKMQSLARKERRLLKMEKDLENRSKNSNYSSYNNSSETSNKTSNFGADKRELDL